MVSYSTTTAIVYGVSGSLFFFLIFLLILLGLEPALRWVIHLPLSLVEIDKDMIIMMLLTPALLCHKDTRHSSRNQKTGSL